MKLFAGGAEVPGWRNLLAAERVPAVSLSFIGLSRRVKHLDKWPLAEKFPDDPGFRQELMVDSGAHSLNKEGAEYSDEDAHELYLAYGEFVAANIHRIDVFSEFDAVQLGVEDRIEMRHTLAFLAPEKFMPIWHPEDSVEYLEELARDYARVGVKQPEQESMSDLAPVLRRISGRTKLHGVAMTRMQAMRDIPWDSVGSTSWLSPGRNGDTIIWTGKELKRYPMKYKEQARKRHRTVIADAGFDPVAIARDATDQGTSEDRKEVLRLSLWSWGQFVDDINRRRESGDTDDGTESKPVRGKSRGEVEIARRDKVLLPILSLSNGPDEETKVDSTQLDSNASNLMQCNTCFARDKCPQFTPDSECAYEIPMQIRTTTQARSLRKAMIEMQAQRVMMMRMFEQFEGGYADPNLSAEMRTLNKMLADDAAADQDGFEMTIRAKGKGKEAGGGIMSNLFGTRVEQQVNALDQPYAANEAIEGYIDAE